MAHHTPEGGVALQNLPVRPADSRQRDPNQRLTSFWNRLVNITEGQFSVEDEGSHRLLNRLQGSEEFFVLIFKHGSQVKEQGLLFNAGDNRGRILAQKSFELLRAVA